jgi:hypothetical protein
MTFQTKKDLRKILRTFRKPNRGVLYKEHESILQIIPSASKNLHECSQFSYADLYSFSDLNISTNQVKPSINIEFLKEINLEPNSLKLRLARDESSLNYYFFATISYSALADSNKKKIYEDFLLDRFNTVIVDIPSRNSFLDLNLGKVPDCLNRISNYLFIEANKFIKSIYIEEFFLKHSSQRAKINIQYFQDIKQENLILLEDPIDFENTYSLLPTDLEIL